MPDRNSPHYDDEPVIGGGYEPRSSGPYYATASYDDTQAVEWEDEYDDGYNEWDEDDDYYEELPTRTPLFFLFVAIATLVGGLLIFLVFTLFTHGGSNPLGTGEVRIDSPTKNQRIEVGRSQDIVVRASSKEPLQTFELYVNDQLVDSVPAGEATPDNVYRATLRYTFPKRDNYTLVVKVVSESGTRAQSEPLKVVTTEPVGDRPQTISGKVIATATLRTGPGDNFNPAGTLDGGKTVKLIGRSSNSEWLLVDIDGGVWVRADAVDPQDSVALLPVRQNNTNPFPTREGPTASTSPTVNPTLVDLIPSAAALADNGAKLRVTVGNLGGTAYSGGITVSVTGLGNTLSKYFQVDVPAKGSVIVEFAVTPAITETKSAKVSIEPGGSLKEGNADNNVATFAVNPNAAPTTTATTTTTTTPTTGTPPASVTAAPTTPSASPSSTPTPRP